MQRIIDDKIKFYKEITEGSKKNIYSTLEGQGIQIY